MLDVPCTGSGVLRRNPDLKWKFSLERMEELIKVQQLILDESVAFLKNNNSKIVYSTCSIFPEENMI
jgi:16S rRNA (cytosine967-C5)-methyltransferase